MTLEADMAAASMEGATPGDKLMSFLSVLAQKRRGTLVEKGSLDNIQAKIKEHQLKKSNNGARRVGMAAKVHNSLPLYLSLVFFPVSLPLFFLNVSFTPFFEGGALTSSSLSPPSPLLSSPLIASCCAPPV